MNQREASRGHWAANGVTVEEINSGSLQRIADATEKMAASYDAMQVSRDRYKQWYEEEQQNLRAANRSIVALRGVITRMKRKA